MTDLLSMDLLTAPFMDFHVENSHSLSRVWREEVLTDLENVTDMLDCLEASGFAERRVEMRDSSTFVVSWR